MWNLVVTTQFKNDFLLVLINQEEQTISLVRLGSHSELFK